MILHYANFPLWNRKIIWVISLSKPMRLWNFVDLYNEITWLQHPVQSLLFKLIIKLSCHECCLIMRSFLCFFDIYLHLAIIKRLWLYNDIIVNIYIQLDWEQIIKLSCPENKKKEKQLKPKVEEPINIDNGKILSIITACCRTVWMLF
jgi:hypothetical protein